MRCDTSVLISLLVLLASGSSSSTSGSPRDKRHALPTAASTCRPASANHITHTLPQQCLAGNRTIATRTSTIVLSTSTTITVSVVSPSLESELSNDSRPAPTDVNVGLITTTATVESTPSAIAAELLTPEDAEIDSPLDTANFLSFEDWKRRNLASVGQSPEHVGQHRSADDKQRRPRPGSENTLDVLGDDTEIELDFTGFGAAQNLARPPLDVKARDQETNGGATASDRPAPSQQNVRSKDAGTTCKERTNYASFDCAATVLKTNPECKSASSVLVENKDSYMLNICKVKNKFFIVELCDDILIDTVVLANYEFFSSIFRTFRLSVSDRYPAKADKWRELGVYEARNARQVQAFLIEQPLIWARYLRIEILSHYGNEYYCPISLLRVHGTTMMAEFRNQEEIARGEYPEDGGVEEAEVETVAQSQEPTISSILADKSVAATVAAIETHGSDTASISAPLMSSEDSTQPTDSASRSLQSSLAESARVPPDVSSSSTSPSSVGTQHTTSAPKTDSSSTTQPENATTYSSNASNNSISAVTAPSNTNNSVSSSGAATGNLASSTNGTAVTEPASAVSSARISSTSNGTTTSSTHASSVATSNRADSIKRSSPSNVPGSASSPPPPVPSTQESFFKSIHKRLQTLESNATLSLAYIEDQSRLLRTAFAAVEKRQVRKTETFLSLLNATVSAELRAFRQQADTLWESTVSELESQRVQHQGEMLAVSARLNLVAEELLFQKRMVIVQSTLLMLCLGLVLFSRVGGGGASSAMGASGLQDVSLLRELALRSGLSSRGGLLDAKRGMSTVASGARDERSPSPYSPPESPTSLVDVHGASPASARTATSSLLGAGGGYKARLLGNRSAMAALWRRSMSPSAGEEDEEEETGTEGEEHDGLVSRDDHGRLLRVPGVVASIEEHGGGTTVEEEEEEEDEGYDGEMDGLQLDELGGDAVAEQQTQSGPTTPTGTRELLPLPLSLPAS